MSKLISESYNLQISVTNDCGSDYMFKGDVTKTDKSESIQNSEKR